MPVRGWFIVGLLFSTLALTALWAGEDRPPAEQENAGPGDLGLDYDKLEIPTYQEIRPHTIFQASRMSRVWTETVRRTDHVSTDVQQARETPMLGMLKGFKGLEGFRAEKYTTTGQDREIMVELTAENMTKEEGKDKEPGRIIINNLALSYFITSATLLETQQMAAAVTKAPPTGAKPAVIPTNLGRNRVVIKAQRGLIPEGPSGEGECSGGVRVEIYAELATVGSDEPTSIITCEGLRWRTWDDPTIGSSELLLWAVSPQTKTLPTVNGELKTRQADGTTSSMKIQARGMIFEMSTLKIPEQRKFEEVVVGKSLIRRRRAIFQSAIRVETEGSVAAAFIPFQQAAGVTPKEKEKEAKKDAKKAAVVPEPPSKTTIDCRGPAILDLAALPLPTPDIDPNRIVPLGERFEFLNDVSLVKEPIEQPKVAPPGSPPMSSGTRAKLHCNNLCIQFKATEPIGEAHKGPDGKIIPMKGKQAAGEKKEEKQSSFALPEFAEALGRVHMEGFKADPPGAPPVPQDKKVPFVIDCPRLYFDGRQENLTLEGFAGPGTNVSISDELGELTTMLCLYSLKDQSMSMPKQGFKRLVIKPTAFSALSNPQAPGDADPKAPVGAKAPADPKAPAVAKAPADPKAPANPAAPGGGLSLAEHGDLILEWSGPFLRHLIKVPGGPGEPDQDRESIHIHREVDVHQVNGGLKLRGDRIRLVREPKSGRLEVLEGRGGAEFSMDTLTAKGESLALRMLYQESGEVLSQDLVVAGDPKAGISAILKQPGSVIKGDRFFFDMQKQMLRAFGGILARVSMPSDAPAPGAPKPATPPPAAAPGAGLGGLGLGTGMMDLQCDGDMVFDGLNKTLKISKNVVVHQKGSPMHILADTLLLTLGADEPDKTKPANAQPDTGMMGGGLKTVECLGQVEVATDSQVIICDRMLFDVPNQKGTLETFDPSDKVRVYLKDENTNGARMLVVDHQLIIDGKSGVFTPEKRLLLQPYSDTKPMPRKKAVLPPLGAPEGKAK